LVKYSRSYRDEGIANDPQSPGSDALDRGLSVAMATRIKARSIQISTGPMALNCRMLLAKTALRRALDAS
jgi:hypothetical protein